MSEPEAQVHHDPDVRRFALAVDGSKAYLDYDCSDGTMTITHTWVPGEIGGRGLASQLVRAAVEHARERGWTVRPECAYARTWLQRHPEYAALQA